MLTKLRKKALSACQGAKLLTAIFVHSTWTCLSFLLALLRSAFGATEQCSGVEFLEGWVSHARTHEASHAFRYDVRMALVDLDHPPHWWALEPIQRLTAEERWYHQNPIQIYFCEDQGEYKRGVCEVTNTPWNHHVFFVFDLKGDEQLGFGVWKIWFPRLFRAHLQLQPSSFLRARAEHAGSLQMLWRYGFQPQRTALRIYWNAVKLLRFLEQRKELRGCLNCWVFEYALEDGFNNLPCSGLLPEGSADMRQKYSDFTELNTGKAFEWQLSNVTIPKVGKVCHPEG
ncbi:Uncharacterized protein (Fragment) [Durusdinium trenchii]|uniref:Uncharacterized protein n=1 Tax=Durusdinium trenchii TaxID=1381693 RepID=A0ABP0I292_9DINO